MEQGLQGIALQRNYKRLYAGSVPIVACAIDHQFKEPFGKFVLQYLGQAKYQQGMPLSGFLTVMQNRIGASLKEDELGIDHWELWIFCFIGWHFS